ncbi:hypothetical protein GGI13_005329 [Coemansia sp. RSA 455]|nr:hypothetical protein GGI13_005329 [Coemansia sp. RSA 455]
MVESVEPSNFIGTYDKTFRGADINVLATEAHDHIRLTTIGYNENIQIDFVGLSIEVDHSFEGNQFSGYFIKYDTGIDGHQRYTIKLFVNKSHLSPPVSTPASPGFVGR